jgi:DNA replication protein DnaC
VSELRTPLEVAGIQQICKRLHMPTIGAQCARLAEQALKEKQSHLSYLETLLEAEWEEGERNVMERRLKEARFPKVKTLEEFNSEIVPHLPATGLRKLAEGQYIEKTEPLVFIGDTGTGKTHLATALGVAACRQRRPAQNGLPVRDSTYPSSWLPGPSEKGPLSRAGQHLRMCNSAVRSAASRS